MRGAALFLLWHSALNRIRGLRHRFRSPRYAFAMLLGMAYLGLVFLGQRRGTGGALPAPAVAMGGAIFLIVLVLKWWIFGADRNALAFSPAEIHFFFPAPVSRASLLVYKVVRAQPLLLVNVLVWTFLLHHGDSSPVGTPFYGLSLWLFFNILFLHRLGVALTRDSASDHGLPGLRRNLPAFVVVVGVAAAAWLSYERLPAGSWGQGVDGILGGLKATLETAPLRIVAWPFRIPVAPLEAPTITAWLHAMVSALALLTLHLAWVIRADRAFGEAALDASARHAERLERWRRQGASATLPPRRTRFWIRLAPTGHPIAAIVWKNATRLARTLSPAFLWMIALVGIGGVGLGWLRGQDDPDVLRLLGTVAFTWVIVLALLGPQWVRIDLRGELEYLSVLRTWPLSGLAIMWGQVLSSAIVLTTLQLLLGAFALQGLWSDATGLLSAEQIAALLLPAALIFAALNIVSLSIQNAAALLYPAWVRSEIRPGGFEQVGQHLLTAGISLLLLLLAALGPTLAAGAATYLLWARIGAWALLPGLLLAGLALTLEAFLILDWLGDRFERADPSTA